MLAQSQAHSDKSRSQSKPNSIPPFTWGDFNAARLLPTATAATITTTLICTASEDAKQQLADDIKKPTNVLASRKHVHIHAHGRGSGSRTIGHGRRGPWGNDPLRGAALVGVTEDDLEDLADERGIACLACGEDVFLVRDVAAGGAGAVLRVDEALVGRQEGLQGDELVVQSCDCGVEEGGRKARVQDIVEAVVERSNLRAGHGAARRRCRLREVRGCGRAEREEEGDNFDYDGVHDYGVAVVGWLRTTVVDAFEA
ncbi:hypothetical protein BJX65DRAFT_43175 [Aspergillus insuetus]